RFPEDGGNNADALERERASVDRCEVSPRDVVSNAAVFRPKRLHERFVPFVPLALLAALERFEFEECSALGLSDHVVRTLGLVPGSLDAFAGLNRLDG